MNNKEIDKEYEKCIYFLAEKLRRCKNNTNTLIHSIRVGLNIQKDGLDTNMVKAGFLHDIFEDTNIQESELKNQYNNKIVELILNTTADYSVGNEEEVLVNMYARCLNYGDDALLLKCYDIEDKMKYYKYSIDKKVVHIHNYKYKLFLDISKDRIFNYKIWKKMKNEYEECKKTWKSNGLI